MTNFRLTRARKSRAREIRVLFVNHTGEVSGAEHSILTLAHGLIGAGIPCSMACPTEGPLSLKATDLGIDVLQIEGTGASIVLHPWRTTRAIAQMVLSAVAVARIARRQGASVIHANSLRAGVIAGLAGWMARLPVVTHLRDRGRPGVATTASLRAVGATSAVIIANSQFTAEGASLAGLRRQVEVIANPIDLARFDVQTSEARGVFRREQGLPEDAFVVSVIAQISPWKRQHVAIEVMAELAEEFPQLRLLIVGEAKFLGAGRSMDNASYKARLTELAASPELSGRVKFLGERADIAEILNASDALMLPSIGEPFGRVLVEAMAASKPAIASDDGGAREILEHGVSGILVNPDDRDGWVAALRLLLSSPEHGRAIGEHAREQSRQYSIPNHVASMLEIYRLSISSTRRPHGPSTHRPARN